jgi:hypothetical protein
MNRIRAGSAVAALALAAAAQPARAQGVASINAIVRVVKTAPAGSASFSDAKVGSRLDAGGRVRTGGRSKAGVLFANKSVLKLDELTEVIVSGARQTDVRVLGGRILADYTRPGTVTGGYATAAVRGTKVIYFENPETQSAYVRVYEGVAYVAKPGIDLRAGNAALSSPTTLVDPDLVGDTLSWTGKTVKVVAGANRGQKRTVTAFDPATGTLTLDQPLAGPVRFRQAGGGGVEYLLSSDPAVDAAEVEPGEGVTVRGGAVTRRYSIAPMDFAEGQRNPWFDEIRPGLATLVYPGTMGWQEVQERDSDVRDGTKVAVNEPNVGNPQVLVGTGELHVIIPPPETPPSGQGMPARAALNRLPALLASGGSAGAGMPLGVAAGPAAAALGAVGLHQPGGPARERVPGTPEPAGGAVGSPEANAGAGVWFLADPFAIAGSSGHFEGLRVRMQAVNGPFFVEFGGRGIDNNGDARGQLSEASVQGRERNFDIIAGRQRFFLGPANNSDIAKILGFDTVDCVLVRSRIPGKVRAQAGYIWNSNPLFGPGFAGPYSRAEAFVGSGIFGWQMLGAKNAGTQLGWSLDATYPLVKNMVDVYSEGGVDPFGNNMAMAGLYFQGIYQMTGIDVFTEFHHRAGFNDRANLRLRKAIGKHLSAFLFVDKQLDGPIDGGGALQYSIRLP